MTALGSPDRTDPLSIVLTVDGRCDPLPELIADTAAALAPLGAPLEFILVVNAEDGRFPDWIKALERTDVLIADLPGRFGSAARLREGIRLASAERLLLLPAYHQVDVAALPDVVRALDDADMVICARDRCGDSRRNRMRAYGFRALGRLAGSRFDDLGCLVRASRKEALEAIPLQDNHQNYLGSLAEFAGFTVAQLRVPQAAADTRHRSHHLRRFPEDVLDALSVSFLVRFLTKPFRLFGAVGAGLVALGLLLGVALTIQRFTGTPLSDRPALLLSVLLIVLGLQIAFVGLIAEIVLFTRLPKGSAYRIKRIHDRARSRRDHDKAKVGGIFPAAENPGDTERAASARRAGNG